MGKQQKGGCGPYGDGNPRRNARSSGFDRSDWDELLETRLFCSGSMGGLIMDGNDMFLMGGSPKHFEYDPCTSIRQEAFDLIMKINHAWMADYGQRSEPKQKR